MASYDISLSPSDLLHLMSSLMTSLITNLESDNLECEIKWALGSMISNKASGGDGFPAELCPS